MELLIVLITFLAGIVQGVTGFGAGIVMMMILPTFFSLPQSAGISTAIGLFLNLSMVITYRKHIKFKAIIIPSLSFIFITSAAILFSTHVDQVLMKKLLGVLFVCLSIYYIFFNKQTNRKLSLPVSVLFIVISGVCSGLFGIGGPLMVLYYLSQINKQEEYLGTIQTFFLINSIYNTGLRIFTGILLPEHIFLIMMGIVSIVAGGIVARKIVNKLDGALLRKITYVMIGIAGLLNIFK